MQETHSTILLLYPDKDETGAFGKSQVVLVVRLPGTVEDDHSCLESLRINEVADEDGGPAVPEEEKDAQYIT